MHHLQLPLMLFLYRFGLFLSSADWTLRHLRGWFQFLLYMWTVNIQKTALSVSACPMEIWLSLVVGVASVRASKINDVADFKQLLVRTSFSSSSSSSHDQRRAPNTPCYWRGHWSATIRVSKPVFLAEGWRFKRLNAIVRSSVFHRFENPIFVYSVISFRYSAFRNYRLDERLTTRFALRHLFSPVYWQRGRGLSAEFIFIRAMKLKKSCVKIGWHINMNAGVIAASHSQQSIDMDIK